MLSYKYIVEWLNGLFTILGVVVGSSATGLTTWLVFKNEAKKQYKRYQREELWRLIRWAISEITKDERKNHLVVGVVVEILESEIVQEEDKKIAKIIIDYIIQVYGTDLLWMIKNATKK